MKQTIVILYGVIYLILFSSCEKEVSLPSQNSGKLVVLSYISPQKPAINVFVSISRPYYGETTRTDPSIGMIDNATVTIFNGSTTATIPWNATQKQYALSSTLLPFPISDGTTYTLQVSTPDMGSVSAQTSIPKPIAGTNFNFIGLQKNIETDSYTQIDLFTYQFSVPNAPSQGVYYRFYPTLQINSMSTTTNRGDDASNNPAYGDPYLQEYTPSITGSSDRKLDLTKRYDKSNIPSIGTPLSHTGYFISCSKEYYFFYKTAPQNIGIQTIDLSTNFENLYSNINGGYGVFAGYNQVTVDLLSSY
jgi:hypothetical protein